MAGLAVVGVPLMRPEDEFRLSPPGRDGAMEYVSGAVPPEPVTGVKGAGA